MSYIKVFIILAVLIGIHITAPALYAQSFSMSLNPEKHEVISKRGQIITLPYSLTNLGDPQLLLLKIYLLSQTNSTHYELFPYEKITPKVQFAVVNAAMELNKPFLMNGKSTVLFDVEVTIPEATPIQDYYFTFVAESEALKGAEGTSSIQLEGGVGSNILVTVTDSGQVDRSAQITRFDIPSSRSTTIRGEKYYFVNSSQAIPFALTIKNIGKNYIKASGSINSAAAVPIKLPETTILSGSQKVISSTKTELFPSKIFGLEKIIATIQVGNSQIIYGAANIIVLPVKTLIAVGIILIVGLAAYFFIKRRQKK